jgi:hypothetical protein
VNLSALQEALQKSPRTMRELTIEFAEHLKEISAKRVVLRALKALEESFEVPGCKLRLVRKRIKGNRGRMVYSVEEY